MITNFLRVSANGTVRNPANSARLKGAPWIHPPDAWSHHTGALYPMVRGDPANCHLPCLHPRYPAVGKPQSNFFRRPYQKAGHPTV